MMRTIGMILALVALSLGADRAAAAATIGIRAITVTDRTRRDTLKPNLVRRWNVEIYYPAAASSHRIPRAYVTDTGLIDFLVGDQYYGQPAAALRGWLKRPGPAVADAAQAPGTPGLIVIAPGMGVAGVNYAYLAAQLVRRGFVVAVIELPYLGYQVLPDGRLLSVDDDALAASNNPEDYAPRLREFVRDISRSIDSIGATVRYDHHAITVTGHSSGGTVAVDSCRADARVSGCVDLEGGLEGSELWRSGATRPILIGASRAGGRPETSTAKPDMIDQMRAALAKGGSRSGWVIKITGGSHMSYSDSPLVMPDTITRFGGTTISPARSMTLYPDLVAAFARAYAPRGGGNAAMARFLRSQPEITRIEATGPE